MDISEKQLERFIKSCGCSASTAEAKTALLKVVKKLVFNMIDNARYVSDACDCKVIKAGHFKAVDQLMRRFIAQAMAAKKPIAKAQRGGFTVLPSEYFAIDSGRYFPESVVRPFETHAFGDPSVTRAAQPISDGSMQTGGAGFNVKLVGNSLIKLIVDEYNKKRKLKSAVRVSSNAMPLILASVHQNIKDLLRHIAAASRGKPTKLTASLIRKTVTTHPQYSHMA